MFEITHYKIDIAGKTIDDVKRIEDFNSAVQVLKNKARHVLNAYPDSCIVNQTFSDDVNEIRILSLCVTHHIVLTKMDC